MPNPTAPQTSTSPQPVIAVTTDYLHPDDEVDHMLRTAGFDTRHPRTSGPMAMSIEEALAGAVGAVVGNDPITADVLDSCPDLRAIVRTGAGYDSIDVEAATTRGISVSNLPAINAVAVAEYAIGLVLNASRQLVANAAAVRSGSWPRTAGREIRGAVLGVVGYGAIGREVTTLASALGMTVLVNTNVPTNLRTPEHPHGPHFVALQELLEQSDYVTLHTALNPQTRRLIDAAALARMKQSAVLINTARGGLVDEQALADAVAGGEIAGAELDVVDAEPLPADSPLRHLPAVNVYPHLAGQSDQARAAAGRAAAVEVIAALDGNASSSVNAHLPEFARLA